MAMAPTLIKSDYIVVRSSAYMSEAPASGDVIVFRYPRDRSIAYVFRVVGGSGDHVVIRDGKIYVNDLPLAEPYLANSQQARRYSAGTSDFQVPTNHVFVLGDNRENALDGRFWGTVPREDVIGKVTYIWMADDRQRIGSVR